MTHPKPLPNFNSGTNAKTCQGIKDLLGGGSNPTTGDRVKRGDTPSLVQDTSNPATGGAGGEAPAYLEPIAKVSIWLDTTCDKQGAGWFISGECQNGHRFAKEIVCGKEWCSVCGEDGSVAHNRRFSRWLPRIQQFKVMGYFVFTLPESVRGKYRTKKSLSKLGHQVQELLKSHGFSRGLRRWHWFGDESTNYHPHLNVLVDGGFVSPRKLEAIKKGYASLLGVDLADVNYHYRRSPGKMVHTLKYVVRSSFRNYEWDVELAVELRGFRNMVVWGKWDGEAVWSLADLTSSYREEVEELDIQAVNSLRASVCPECGEALIWSKPLPIGLLAVVDKQPLGAGYWRLVDVRPPPGLPDDVKQLLYWLKVRRQVEARIAREQAEAEFRVARAVEAEYQQVLWRDLLH